MFRDDSTSIKRSYKMKIDIRSESCLYVEINNKTFYIDDSTGESIMDCWNNVDPREEIQEIINSTFPKEEL